MDLLATTQSVTPLDLARVLAAKTLSAGWQNCGRDAAILHFFMDKTTCEERHKVAHRILRENALGNYQALIEEFTVIETAPWHNDEKSDRTKAGKEDAMAQCSICNFKGHAASECGGKCGKCGKFGHMTSKCWGVPSSPLIRTRKPRRQRRN